LDERLAKAEEKLNITGWTLVAVAFLVVLIVVQFSKKMKKGY
jgi:hypothetical protein